MKHKITKTTLRNSKFIRFAIKHDKMDEESLLFSYPDYRRFKSYRIDKKDCKEVISLQSFLF